MARPRDPELRGRLIAAAGQEFSEKGFAGASIDAIAERVGVTKGGVYFHFRTKEDLFFATVDHWRGAHRELVAPRPGVTLRSFLVGYLAFHLENPEVFGILRVLASEMRGRFTTRVREDHRATLRAVRLRIRELLVEGTHDGTLFTTDPALATFVLAATVEGVLSLVASAPRDAEPFRHPESIVDFVLGPYETGGAGGLAREPAEGVDFLPPF